MFKHARILALAAATAAGSACLSPDGEGVAMLDATTCTSASAWAPWTTYATGQAVSFGGSMYQCVQGHTSQPGWEPSVVPAL